MFFIKCSISNIGDENENSSLFFSWCSVVFYVDEIIVKQFIQHFSTRRRFLVGVENSKTTKFNRFWSKINEKPIKFYNFWSIFMKSNFCSFWILNPITKFSDRKPSESRFQVEHDSQIWNPFVWNLPNLTSKSERAQNFDPKPWKSLQNR